MWRRLSRSKPRTWQERSVDLGETIFRSTLFPLTPDRGNDCQGPESKRGWKTRGVGEQRSPTPLKKASLPPAKVAYR
jgi:hypothetical protein